MVATVYSAQGSWYVMGLFYSQKESYSSCGTVKAVLIKDKSSKAETSSEPQQFIEVHTIINYVIVFMMVLDMAIKLSC